MEYGHDEQQVHASTTQVPTTESCILAHHVAADRSVLYRDDWIGVGNVGIDGVDRRRDGSRDARDVAKSKSIGHRCTQIYTDRPFTKRLGLVHDLTRAAVSFVPVLDPVWRNLDDLLGYGKEKDTTLFWKSGS